MLEGQAKALSTREIIEFSKNVWAKILAHWIGVQGLSKLFKKNETPQLCEPLPGEPLTQIKNCSFNRIKKSCRIRRGFEQLSSYSGWRVITKKPRANLLAFAVVKGSKIYTRISLRCQVALQFIARHRRSTMTVWSRTIIPTYGFWSHFSYWFASIWSN